MALAAQKKWPEAIAAFRAAVEKDPEMSEAWFQIGYSENEKNGGVGKATEASHAPLAHCLKLDPKHANAHTSLGNLLKDVRKDYDGAERHYRKAIELEPSDAEIHFIFGYFIEIVRKDYEGAERLYRKAIELDPKNVNAHWDLSRFLENQKNDIPGAIKAVEEYIRRGNPDNDGEQRLEKLRAKLK